MCSPNVEQLESFVSEQAIVAVLGVVAGLAAIVVAGAVLLVQLGADKYSLRLTSSALRQARVLVPLSLLIADLLVVAAMAVFGWRRVVLPIDG